MWLISLAVRRGFEPRLKAPKTSVLPLHHRTNGFHNDRGIRTFQPGFPSIRTAWPMQANAGTRGPVIETGTVRRSLRAGARRDQAGVSSRLAGLGKAGGPTRVTPSQRH